MQRCIALCLCCRVLGTLALRRHTCTGGAPPGAADATPDAPGADPLTFDRQGSGGERLPSAKQYAEEWEQLYSSDENLREPLPSSVQLVLGVMTIAEHSDYREVVRRTWMSQAGVCYWQRRPRPDCSVYVAFVVGGGAGGTPAVKSAGGRLEEGMLELGIEENINDGKSFVWFATALKMFPWATHIGKMDMDTYPYLHRLVPRIGANRSCVSSTSPYELIGRPATYCMAPCKPFAGHCPEEDCHGQLRAAGGRDDGLPIGGSEWYFFQGELYIMSLSLVQQVEWAPQEGNEDIMVSRAVESAMRGLRSCVVFRREWVLTIRRRLDGWIHMHHRKRRVLKR